MSQVLLVSKSKVQWKRELMRGELPDLKRQELQEVSKMTEG